MKEIPSFRNYNSRMKAGYAFSKNRKKPEIGTPNRQEEEKCSHVQNKFENILATLMPVRIFSRLEMKHLSGNSAMK